MKLFRKKNERKTPAAKPESGANFYTQHAGESPLNEYFDDRASKQTQRTSRHSAAHRRESSNRASNGAIFMLLLRAGLIVLLLVGGFVVLKLVLNRMARPSEADHTRWEAKAEKMAAAGSSVATVKPGTGVSAAQIEQRLGLWEKAERLLRSAEALDQRGIDEDAAAKLNEVLQIMPENRAALQLLMDIYMRRGLYTEAVPVCIRLLDQAGLQQEIQMNLLQALQSIGQIDAGLLLADKMLEDQPNNAEILSIAAAGQIALGNNDVALELFQRMLDNDEKNQAALVGCGNIYFERSSYSNAIPYYLELVRLDPKMEYYQMLARCYSHQNESGKAVIFLGQAASLFGGGEVSPWLKDPAFDPVRESVEFRSFADRVVGVEARKAIEVINRREAEKKAPAMGGELELPTKSSLNAITPGK